MNTETAPDTRSIEELETIIAADRILLRQAEKVWNTDKITHYRAEIIANLKAVVGIYEKIWQG